MRIKVTKFFLDFFDSEQSSGILLLGSAILSLVIANSTLGNSFINFWHINIGMDIGPIHLKHDLMHWVNDGLMAIFFLMIGLEIEREIYQGELSNLKNAALPIFAAIGGAILPALIHFSLNNGTTTQSGFGIPMATDIAFALAILAILGKGIPVSVKIFLTALAIIDDLIAIIIIAIFYSGKISFLFLGIALAILLIMAFLNWYGEKKLWIYLTLGLVVWYFFLESGVHATIAGVLIAFVIPFGSKDGYSPSHQLVHALHKPVAYLIMPIFALANTAIMINTGLIQNLISPNTIGIFIGLLVGKPTGIVLFSILAVKTKMARIAPDFSMRHLIGSGFLGGIGFTMSIFITMLAFADPILADLSKITIILSSILAGAIGYVILKSKIIQPVMVSMEDK